MKLNFISGLVLGAILTSEAIATVPRYTCELVTVEKNAQHEVVQRVPKKIFFDLKADPLAGAVLIREDEKNPGTGKYGQIIESNLEKGALLHPVLAIHESLPGETGSFANLQLLYANLKGSSSSSLFPLSESESSFFAKLELQVITDQGHGMVGLELRCRNST